MLEVFLGSVSRAGQEIVSEVIIRTINVITVRYLLHLFQDGGSATADGICFSKGELNRSIVIVFLHFITLFLEKI